jgi:hypothetical protein
MPRPAKTVLILSSVLVVSGSVSAGEHEETRRLYSLALDRFLEGQARVMGVADHIRIAGAPLCGKKVAPVIGAYGANRYTFTDMFPGYPEFKDALAETAVERFDLGDVPTVLLVVPGLSADLAGLHPGDVVIRIDGKKPKPRERLDVLANKGKGGVVRLTVERPDEVVELEIESRLGCMEPSVFWFGTGINAFAWRFGDLTGLYVLGGMLSWLESDDELAFLVGHELAHLILEHSGGPTTGRVEADADYLGVYLAVRAGFDASVAIDFEDRMGRLNPYSNIDWGYHSHPTSSARSLMLRATLEEIAGKVERGEALEPEGLGR